MSNVETILRQTAAAIKSAVGHNVDVTETGSSLVLRFASSASAVVTVTVEDPERRSFGITYPCVKPHHSSLWEAQDVDSTGALLDGVVWIVRAIVEHGVVLPEFPHPHILEQLRRRRPMGG